ncbi:MAG: hypothetical protein WCD76_02975 [Pyrinomonadaceae bacterium]
MAARKKIAKKTEVRGGAGKVEKTPDGHYVRIDGRRWRATNPDLTEDERQRLVNELMDARRAVGKALREKDERAEREARRRVNDVKVALGERGPKWWEKREE